jgi:hypothetical protein
MPPFLLVACVGRRLGGVFRGVATLSQGRIRYRCRSFNMAQGAHDALVKGELIISPTNTRTEGHVPRCGALSLLQKPLYYRGRGGGSAELMLSANLKFRASDRLTL